MAVARVTFLFLVLVCFLGSVCDADSSTAASRRGIKRYLHETVHARSSGSGSSGSGSSGSKPSKSGTSKKKSSSEEDPTPTPLLGSNEDDGDDSDTCFPSSATVRLESGVDISVSKLEIGARVQVSLAGDFSDVFMFTHKLPSGVYWFVKLTTSSGKFVTLSPSHYIYANEQLKPARKVQVGDSLQVLSSSSEIMSDLVESVEMVQETGLYNPQTLHGDIVVNGVRASTYTQAVDPFVAHFVALTPFRFLWRWTRVDFTGGLLHGGGFFKPVSSAH